GRAEAAPGYQRGALASYYPTTRVTPDVSLDANPNTGVAVYDTVPGLGQAGWFQVGGTSAGAPVWAAIVAAADAARAANHLAPLGSTQALNLLYGLYGTNTARAASYATSFHDVTAGVNFASWALRGYDAVTGLGSPIAANIIAAASTYSGPSARAAGVATTGSGATAAAATAVTAASPSATASPAAAGALVLPAANGTATLAGPQSPNPPAPPPPQPPPGPAATPTPIHASD